MAVYTQLDEAEVGAFLARFGLPQLLRLKATVAGIENTNYFVDARDHQGREHPLVLTLFERGSEQALPYFIELTTYLGQQGLPVPSPYRDQNGQALQRIKDKPCVLVPRFSGHHPVTPNPQQCKVIGDALARMHLASPGFTLQRESDRGAHWREQASVRVAPLMKEDQRALLLQQVQAWKQLLPELAQLPAGITHGDLFHDNALFEGERLTGIIDFYNACQDVFLFDLAVLVNDWCSKADFTFDDIRLQAVMAGYEAQRPLTTAECKCWPDMLRFAALRFWLSRLESWHFPSTTSQVQQKDPEPMRQLLLQRLV